jgi:hypothetical protein
MLAKEPKIESKKYREWVASLPCIDCGIEDDTIIAHHLRGRCSPLSGSAARKANDYFVMPLCYKHHMDLHNGNAELLDLQAYWILKTIDKAFKDEVIWFKI